MPKKAFPILLILVGAALVLGALLSWFDNLTAAQPVGLGKWVFDVLQFLLGAAGTGLGAWLNFGRKDKTPPASSVVNAGDQNQTAVGEGARNVQTGGGTYVEHAEKVEIHAPSKDEPSETIGFIPPFKGETYVHRGKIEEDVRAFLKNGGTGAIVGLHAPGGLGKTELAKHAAEDLKGEFEGVLWMDVGDKMPHQLVGEMLMKCGVQSPPNAAYEQQKNDLQHILKERRLLIVFDDVREAALRGLSDYLPPRPCSALITSRIQQIGGVHRTFPLDRLTEEQARELLEAALGEDAVRAEAQAAAKLAERCAFNPLALEIAARRIRQWQGIENPIARYFERAQARFRELKMEGDPRWNMEFVFDLSYNDLSPADQRRFRALAVFAPTGFSPAAAAHVWEMDESGAEEVLSRFINLSLVKIVPGKFLRYRLHDLLDEYANEKLKEDEKEEREAHTALAEWLVALFDEHYAEDRTTAPEVGLEFDNLAKTCEWALENRKGTLLAALATTPRNWLFNYFRQMNDWLRWLEGSLEIGVDDTNVEGKRLKANVRKAIGDVQQFRKETDAALASYDEALKLFRQVGDKLGEANVYLSLGGAKRSDKDYEGAKKDFQNALYIYRTIGDQYSQARALYRLGDCLSEEEKYEEAVIQYEKAIQLWTSIGLNDLVESILKPRLEEARKHL
ncbi:MAG: tetratricopeptide repeat protein [Chloroflexi bacterium]|nr:tetratricopeptide repeat protein [Chloroflexota bacterium]